jgi:hypothetical protein
MAIGAVATAMVAGMTTAAAAAMSLLVFRGPRLPILRVRIPESLRAHSPAALPFQTVRPAHRGPGLSGTIATGQAATILTSRSAITTGSGFPWRRPHLAPGLPLPTGFGSIATIRKDIFPILRNAGAPGRRPSHQARCRQMTPTESPSLRRGSIARTRRTICLMSEAARMSGARSRPSRRQMFEQQQDPKRQATRANIANIPARRARINPACPSA